MRGRLKRSRSLSDLIAIGDRVRYFIAEDGRGVVEEILPRKSALSRCPPPPRFPAEQIIVANPDQVLVICSLRNPPPNSLAIDRWLVACEAEELPVAIIGNKLDLATEEDLDILALYDRPDLDLEVGEISEFHDRGRHTTVVARLLNPEPDLYVADTPGLRQFRFWDIDREQLDAFFPEFKPFLGECRFQPCTHTHEPGCAIKAAYERGEITGIRYESYLKMFEYEF